MTNPKVTVIGAGVGGISTAIHLARNGMDVSVYEKNSFPGGRCAHMVVDGHRFDTGATLLMMTDVYERAWKSMGKELGEEMELIRMDPIYRIKFYDGPDLKISSDLYKLQKEVESAEPGGYQRFLDYMQESYRSYELSMKHIIERNYNGFFSFFNPKNFLLLYRTKAFQNHYKHSGKFFKNKFLRIAFSFQNIYVGQNPMKASAIFSMLPFLELTNGVWYPKGGMNEVTKSLVRIAEENGVRFIYNAPVKRIKTNHKIAEGLILEDDTFVPADIIVSNADVPYVYNKLLPESKAARRIDGLKYTCSAFMFHWGVDTIYPQLEQHNVFVSKDYEKSIEAVFTHKAIPEEPSFYIHSQVRSDSTAAPNGHDSISAIVPVGHMIEGEDRDWESEAETIKKALFARLAKEGMADFEQHIKFEKVFTPATWLSALNLTRGATFGSLNHNIFQMGYMRPHNQHKRFKNLFFAGGSTHPGNGVPMCLISAKLTTEKILKYIH
jgi:phytoene desaturase